MTRDDFFPVPCVGPLSSLVEALKGKPTYNLSTHYACGMSTYLIKGEDDKIIPLTQFVDFAGLMEYLGERAEIIKNSRLKKLQASKILFKLFPSWRSRKY